MLCYVMLCYVTILEMVERRDPDVALLLGTVRYLIQVLTQYTSAVLISADFGWKANIFHNS